MQGRQGDNSWSTTYEAKNEAYEQMSIQEYKDDESSIEDTIKMSHNGTSSLLKFHSTLLKEITTSKLQFSLFKHFIVFN